MNILSYPSKLNVTINLLQNRRERLLKIVFNPAIAKNYLYVWAYMHANTQYMDLFVAIIWFSASKFHVYA